MMKPLLILVAMAGPLVADIAAVAHPEDKFDSSRTVVWTPLFQASWDAMNKYQGGEPVRVEPPSSLIKRFNDFSWGKVQVMPADGWKTWSGPATPEFLKTVNSEAANITGARKGPFRLENTAPGTVAVFGLLDRSLDFQRPFMREKKVPLDFNGGGGVGKVRYFGVRAADSGPYTATVKVLSWRPEEKSHALEFVCTNPIEAVILYRPPANAAPRDFAKAFEQVRTWRKQWKPNASDKFDDTSLHYQDEVKVPYLKLESVIDFKDQLGSQLFYKGKADPMLISRAEQKLKFELHERGAKVRAEVSLEAIVGSMEAPPTFPRSFAYDAPFFVFLWRKDAQWPFFGAWVGDASAMEKW